MTGTTRLKRVASLAAGGTPTVDEPTFWDESGGVPWVSIGDMSDGRPVETTSRRVSATGIASKRLPVGRPGTLLFAMYASIGAVGELAVEATWNQALLGIEPRNGLADRRFIRYWLEHLRPTLSALSRSNTQDNLNAEQVGNFPYPMMPPNEQRAIADYLDTETARIDALITKKRRMIELLDERRAGAHSATLWNSGWPLVRLKYLCGLPTSGNRDHGSFTPDDTGVPCLRGLNVRAGRLDLHNLLRISQEDHLRLIQTQLEAGDLVIVRSGLAGSAAAIPDAFGPCNCVDLVVVRRSPAMLPRLLEYLVNSREAQEQVTRHSAGALLTHFNAVDAGNLELPTPPLEEQSVILAELDRMTERLVNMGKLLEEQLDLLAEHRQALITAAVTGELEIPVAA